MCHIQWLQSHQIQEHALTSVHIKCLSLLPYKRAHTLQDFLHTQRSSKHAFVWRNPLHLICTCGVCVREEWGTCFLNMAYLHRCCICWRKPTLVANLCLVLSLRRGTLFNSLAIVPSLLAPETYRTSSDRDHYPKIETPFSTMFQKCHLLLHLSRNEPLFPGWSAWSMRLRNEPLSCHLLPNCHSSLSLRRRPSKTIRKTRWLKKYAQE